MNRKASWWGDCALPQCPPGNVCRTECAYPRGRYRQHIETVIIDVEPQREKWVFEGRFIAEHIHPDINGKQCYKWTCKQNYGLPGRYVTWVRTVEAFWQPTYFIRLTSDDETDWILGADMLAQVSARLGAKPNDVIVIDGERNEQGTQYYPNYSSARIEPR